MVIPLYLQSILAIKISNSSTRALFCYLYIFIKLYKSEEHFRVGYYRDTALSDWQFTTSSWITYHTKHSPHGTCMLE